LHILSVLCVCYTDPRSHVVVLDFGSGIELDLSPYFTWTRTRTKKTRMSQAAAGVYGM